MNVSNQQLLYIFWLFDFATHQLYTSLRYYPTYIRCDIDETGITIHQRSNTIQLPHTAILNCTLERFSQGLYAGPTNNVVLEIAQSVAQSQRLSKNRLYLVAVHSFHNEPRTPEMETMVTVINAFRAGAVPDAPTNPYEREFIRQGKVAEYDANRWDATVKPNEYTPIPTPAARLLGDLPMMVVIWVIVTVVIGLLAEFFLN